MLAGIENSLYKRMPMKKYVIITSIAFAVALFSQAIAAEMSLLDLPVKDYKVGFADLWVGKNVDNRKVLLHGQLCNDYLFAHAPSWVLYDIPAGVSSFSAWGIRPDGDINVIGSWFYVVKIDGKEVFRSKPLADYPNLEVPIQVSIPPGSKVIELIVDPMKNAFCDHAIWAVPVFK